ncbi:unnamed protein product [Boreogadus saida]
MRECFNPKRVAGNSLPRHQEGGRARPFKNTPLLYTQSQDIHLKESHGSLRLNGETAEVTKTGSLGHGGG